MCYVIAGIVLVALIVPLTIWLVRHNRKRLHIIRCVQAASAEQLERIYLMLERWQPHPACFVLGRTNLTASPEALIPLPDFLLPWSGRVVTLGSGANVAFTVVDRPDATPQLAGKVFRAVPMPPTVEADWENVATALVRVVGEHSELRAALAEVCPAYPAETLQYLLSAGFETFELDPINQVQLGGTPAWIQDPEIPTCPVCARPMNFVLQVPGTLLEGAAPRGTYFFFGCVDHPDQLKTVAQFT